MSVFWEILGDLSFLAKWKSTYMVKSLAKYQQSFRCYSHRFLFLSNVYSSFNFKMQLLFKNAIKATTKKNFEKYI